VSLLSFACEWSEWDERHGRLSREVAVERGGSSRDTMERAGNGASGKRCDIGGVTRTGELAGVSESSRDIDAQTREGERAGENESIGRPQVSTNSTPRLRTFYSFGDDDVRIRHD
jgi:hypothetical protein